MSSSQRRRVPASRNLPQGWAARLALAGCALALGTGGAAHRRHHASHQASQYGRAASDYYGLPNRVHLDAGNLNILRRPCDTSYPMDESMPCGTATGGPPGGRGS